MRNLNQKIQNLKKKKNADYQLGIWTKNTHFRKLKFSQSSRFARKKNRKKNPTSTFKKWGDFKNWGILVQIPDK